MNRLLLLICLIGLIFISSIQRNPSETVSMPYEMGKDPNLSKRVDSLIALMTIEEKASQLLAASPAVDRLDIPAYNWWNECLHGVARNGRATIFPQAIGMAATFDTALIYRVGRAISMEARAKYNLAVARGQRGQYQGLTFWTPNVNIFRDPRWGRGQETYGEDPYLTSRIGVSFVKGLQGNHPRYVQAAGMAKHYAVHNGPEALRHEFNAVVSMKDMWETYLPAFEALVTEAKVEGVMGAYNRTNGQLCCAHPYLMQEVLREKWGFEGYYVSDCGAISDFYLGHKTVKTPEEAAALALNVGTNLNCGSTYESLLDAVEQGLTSEEEIDNNLRELLPTRFKLGLFEPEGAVPFDTIGPGWIRKSEHIDLTLEAAEKSLVLLKNKDNTLPADPNLNSVFVCGPTAAHVQALLANYYGVSEDLKTMLEGVVANVAPHTSVKYTQGALLDRKNPNPLDWFSGNAASSELTIACVGISQLIEGEEGESIMSNYRGDRENIGLPQSQIDFLKNIRSKAKKLVVVITGGSAISCPEVYEMADALIYAWYPGEQGGMAVANTIFGKSIPSGRLPVTVVNSIEDLPAYEDYAMANRTYRYLQKDPQFPFGFGLSYSNFSYGTLKLSDTKIKKKDQLTIECEITNTGKFKADEVVQLYLKDLDASVVVPQQSLKRFERISLAPNESKTVSFTLSAKDLELIDEAGERVLEKGEFELFVGGSSPGERSIQLGAMAGQTARFELK
ncbi:MAG: glycoside hydrolase family 3 C-terminal domain-containing protein [Bacteroidia bacterium]|nr:glycoside hydrolase family 3 C-terminal domain-containing protein [Bacteroidia bacterium]